MTQADFIQEVQAQLGPDTKVSKNVIKEVLDAAAKARLALLSAGEGVLLDGLGSLKIVERAARTGRNPRTGVTINIPAKKAVTFSPSTAVKNAVN
ncbi:HU family DNA-binding protein [Desulfovibrio cuneatus]|uniref:HU family DNA-binding protein n=1 Tax=Desulfovibrio cuneatus TaxID=159728 RepID=UPI00040DA444|nr:HU family DNA-binding protein [Desulfovibrio cuneatus]